MKDLGAECNNRGLERILGGEVDRQMEDTAVIRGVLGAEDHRLPAKQIFFTDRAGRTVRRRIGADLGAFALESS